MRIAVLLPNSWEWLPHIAAPAPTESGGKKKNTSPSSFSARPSTRVKPLAGGPGASLSHCRALHKNGDPNSGLFSRPRLAVDEREHGLPLGDHQYLASPHFHFCCFAWSAGHDPHSANPSAVPSLQKVDGSVAKVRCGICFFVWWLHGSTRSLSGRSPFCQR